jgi:LmbE family N-acetylglucosaminyl deacetylase
MATKTLLAMGAHLDDCIFGVPGIMMQAVRQHYRVVILAMVGDLTNWPPARGREREIVDGTKRLCQEYGAEMRVLNFASMRFDVTLDTKRAVAEVVADVQPDVAFILWPHDTHADHEVASQLSKIALRHGGRVVDPLEVKPTRAIYCYDNGPGHTIGFVPNTFVDVTDAWPQAIEWLGKYMALQQNRPYDPQARDGAQQAKEAIARYRGQTCGVKYAEALWSMAARPQEIL